MSLNHLVAGSSLADLVLECDAILAKESSVVQGTYDAAGGAQSVSAAELLGGYVYNGAAGGGVALTLPAVADVIAALAAKDITAAAGMRLPSMVIRVSDANNLTVTGNTGTTVVAQGDAVLNAEIGMVHLVFTSASALLAVLVRSAS